ncbi:hypothetical protein acdb102_31090 [Acidothermaceae bacterium B102]|nr:hypothetical protein acdb102_31090 [Acidothermaceae bacterium B102]
MKNEDEDEDEDDDEANQARQLSVGKDPRHAAGPIEAINLLFEAVARRRDRRLALSRLGHALSLGDFTSMWAITTAGLGFFLFTIQGEVAALSALQRGSGNSAQATDVWWAIYAELVTLVLVMLGRFFGPILLISWRRRMPDRWKIWVVCLLMTGSILWVIFFGK